MQIKSVYFVPRLGVFTVAEDVFARISMLINWLKLEDDTKCGKNYSNENLKTTIPVTDCDKS
jgi:hypothetical protein